MTDRTTGWIDDGKRASLLLAAVLVAAALAGCVGPSSSTEPAVEETDEPEETSEADDGAGASPRSSTEDDAEEEVEYVEETRSVTWEGTMPGLALACTAAGCVYQEEPTSERDNVHELGTDPEPISADFTLTWDDAHGDVKEMLFGIVTDGCRDGCDEIVWEEGTSGVTISVDDIDLDEDDGFALTVHHTYNYYPADVSYSAGPPVDFTVEGNYTVLAPAS